MEPVKVSLADDAKARRCTVDQLLALADAGHIRLCACTGRHSGEFKNQRGEGCGATWLQKFGARVQ